MSNVIKVFEFLRDFNKIKNKVIINIEDYNDLININQIQESEYIKRENITESDVVLSVKLVEITDLPRIPIGLDSWLMEGYKDLKNDEAQIKEVLVVNNSNIIQNEDFYSSEKRVNDFLEWNEKRKYWVKENRIREYARKLFRKLYTIKSEIDNEAETFELAYSDFMLEFNNKFGVKVKHPIFSKQIEINYIETEDTLEIRFKESVFELNSTFLRHIELNPLYLRQITEKINDENLDFTNIEELKNLANSIMKVLSTSQDINPVFVYEEPIIYKRKKNQGFAKFIDLIIDDITSNGENDVPKYLKDLLYHSDEQVIESTDDFKTTFDGLDKDVLLTLPANEEQLRIVKSLQSNGAVLVQGPPGTGKTHTIANLIGHFLSEGKSILVTSQTEKALSVLKEKVYQDKNYDLRSLCINLSKDKSQRTEMDIAISALAEQQSNFDPYYHKSIIEELKKDREELIEELSTLKQDYLRIKNTEYIDFVYDGVTIKPIDAAKYISEGIDKYDYLKVKTNDHTASFPLSYTELSNLYNMNFDISKDDESIINSNQVNIENLLSPNEFKYLIESLDLSDKNFDTISKIDLDEFDVLNNENHLLRFIIDELETVRSYNEFFDLSINNKPLSLLIIEEIDKMISLLETYDDYSYKKLKYNIEVDYNELTDDLISELLKVEDNKQKNAFTGLFKNLPKRKKIINCIKTKLDVNNLEELRIFNSVIRFETKFIESKDLLNEYFKRFNYKNFDFENLHRSKSNLESMKDSLKLYYKLESKLTEAIGIKKLNTILNNKEGYYDLFSSIINDLNGISRIKLQKYNYSLNLSKYNEYLDKLQYDSQLNSVMNSLFKSAQIKNCELYERDYNAVVYAKSKKIKLTERDALLNKVEKISEELAEKIRLKDYPHNTSSVPAYFFDAWKYNQLSNQLDKLDELNKNDIREKIRLQNQKIVTNAQKLAHHKAWLLSMSSLTIDQKRNINAWKQTIRKIGAGKGKKAPMLIREARDIMTKCQSAIPVWIMPLAQVVETFDPTINKFDVLIIDEASQADLLALSALYLGKQIIIVGDDKQVSPSSVGIKDEILFQLQKQFLSNIPNFKLYDEKRSLYDLAMLGNFRQVVLREHFRCYPDIIGFSNKWYYNGRIEPLRDVSNEILKPSVIEYRVQNGYREPNSKLNVNEAKATVSLLLSMLSMDEYNDKTFGIISMLGHEHANYIRKLILESIDVKVIEKCKITVGSPSHFQGDERDIIFLNLVDSAETARLIASGALDGSRDKEYNVATSRAKDQLWVVHSLNPERDLNPDDLRFRLIQHIRNPKSTEFESLTSLSESDFEKEVMNSLLGLGYKVIPQYTVGRYRIDMIIHDGNKRVALECDGERFHGEDQVENDLMRQIQLERLGWSFIRLRGSMYYSNKEKGINYVVEKLNNMKIYPSTEILNEQTENSEILQRIKVKSRDFILDDFKTIKKKEEFKKDISHSQKREEFIKPESEISKPNDVVKEFLYEFKVQKTSLYNEPKLTEIEIVEKRLSEIQKLIHECVDLESNILKLRVGDYVYHGSFGYGRIVNAQVDNIEVKLFLSKTTRKFKKDPKFIIPINKEKLIEFLTKS